MTATQDIAVQALVNSPVIQKIHAAMIEGRPDHEHANSVTNWVNAHVVQQSDVADEEPLKIIQAVTSPMINESSQDMAQGIGNIVIPE